jgi:hypothetical protein
MRFWSGKRLSAKVALLAAVLGLAGTAAAQEPFVTPYRMPYHPPQSCPTVPPLMPSYPSTMPTTPTTPSPTGEAQTPSTTPQAAAAPSDTAAAGAFPTGTAGAGYGGQSAVGYIDPAMPQTMFRLRFDAAFDSNRADRAEYFYGAWRELSFHPHAIINGGVFYDPRAKGPDQSAQHLNYQEASGYFEWAITQRFSVFGEVPWRFVEFNGNQEDDSTKGPRASEPFATERENDTENGLSDIQLGFKYAFIADPDQRYLTLQTRFYIPTGFARDGLGTGHVSIEPGLLFFQRLNDRLVLEGEFLSWNPVAGSAEAGNILQYGLGLSYSAYQRCNLRIVPVAEVVGWTVLNGFESFIGLDGGFTSAFAPPSIAATLPINHGVESASGATIVNAKIGIRTYFGNGNDFYIGYGQCVTGSRWYRDIARIEYRYTF